MKKPQKSSMFWLKMLTLLIGAVGTLVIIFGIGTYVFYIKDIATPENLMNRNNIGLVLTDRTGIPFYKSQEVKDLTVASIDNIALNLQLATIAIEDKDFNTHSGFSVRGIERALYQNFLVNTGQTSGGSTITQQLVKNALLSPEKSIRRKFQEIILAFEIERKYSKDKILEMYLNSIYYGAGAYGIEEASQTYFGTHASDLTLAQAALLAALPQAPSAYSPFGGDLEALYKRKNIVLQKMTEQGYITEKQRETAINKQFTFIEPPQDTESTDAPHFALWVKDYLYKKYGEDTVTRSGMHVRTTLDLNLQKTAQKAVANQVKNLKFQQVSNGGLVSIDPNTGEVLALVGSYDWFDPEIGKFNVAFAHRQPGSSFKPIVYTRAFEDGSQPSDQYDDKPIDIDGYKPQNYDRRFRGKVTLRRALANSLNVPAVELLQKVGINNAITTAQNLGITTLTHPDMYGLSLVLGGGEVELFELTRAYGALATDGYLVPSHLIISIEDKYGKTIYNYNTQTLEEQDTVGSGSIFNLLSHSEPFADKLIGGTGKKRVLDDAGAYMTTSILSDDRSRSEVFGTGSALLLSRPAAAKTGTTDDYRDSWTIGYTPDLVTGVWIGNNDNSPMGRVAGSVGAAPIWHSVMEYWHKDKPVHNFFIPSSIIAIEVCTNTLLPACNNCGAKYLEVFRKGKEPHSCEAVPTSPPSPTAATETPEPTSEPTENPTDSPQPTPTSNPTPTIQPTGIVIPTNIVLPSPTQTIQIIPTSI